MEFGQSLTELKNKVIRKITDDEEIIRALVIDSEDFLTATPTDEQFDLIQNPEKLIRKQIMPYMRITIATNEAKPYITTSWMGFRKIGKLLKNGTVYFYIIHPITLEKTDYGIRYDFIADKLDSILGNVNGIGEFEFNERSDIPVDSKHLGHCISFRIIDFYGV